MSLAEASLAKWEFGILVAEFLVVAGILIAELYGISLERRSYELYKKFFLERSDWYARRARQPRRSAIPATSGDSADSNELLRGALPREIDSQREEVRQEQPEDGSALSLAIQDEIEANESGERTDPDS